MAQPEGTTDTAKIEQILATIEHHVARARKALVDTEVEVLDDAGQEISGLGDMIRDAL